MAEAAADPSADQVQARGASPRVEAPRAGLDEKRRRALMIIGGIAGVVLLGLLFYLLLTHGKESTDDAQVDADVVLLAPHVAGQVVAVPVAENQAVKKGQVVIQIDDRDYQARLAQ